jgi:hypothetical protein
MQVYRTGLTPDATASLAISGLIGRINSAASAARDQTFREAGAEVLAGIETGAGARPRGRNQPVGIHYAKSYWERVLSVTYSTTEGRKRLLDFTLGDTRALMARFENGAATLRKRREAMRLAERLLVARKVDVIRDLPVDEKAAIAEALR